MQLGDGQAGRSIGCPAQADVFGLGLDLEHGKPGGVDIAAFQRNSTGNVLAAVLGLLIQIDAAQRALGQILADQAQGQLHAVGNILHRGQIAGGDKEADGVHHRHHLVRHPQQHADIVAVDQLLEVAVYIEFLGLIRGLGHLFGQGDQLEQGAQLIRDHQGHIAVGFAAGAQHHGNILGVFGPGLHLQLIIGAVDKVAGRPDADVDDIIFILCRAQRCGIGQFLADNSGAFRLLSCRRGGHRQHTKHHADRKQQRDPSFGLHTKTSFVVWYHTHILPQNNPRVNNGIQAGRITPRYR